MTVLLDGEIPAGWQILVDFDDTAPAEGRIYLVDAPDGATVRRADDIGSLHVFGRVVASYVSEVPGPELSEAEQAKTNLFGQIYARFVERGLPKEEAGERAWRMLQRITRTRRRGMAVTA